MLRMVYMLLSNLKTYLYLQLTDIKNYVKIIIHLSISTQRCYFWCMYSVTFDPISNSAFEKVYFCFDIGRIKLCTKYKYTVLGKSARFTYSYRLVYLSVFLYVYVLYIKTSPMPCQFCSMLVQQLALPNHSWMISMCAGILCIDVFLGFVSLNQSTVS